MNDSTRIELYTKLAQQQEEIDKYKEEVAKLLKINQKVYSNCSKLFSQQPETDQKECKCKEPKRFINTSGVDGRNYLCYSCLGWSNKQY